MPNEMPMPERIGEIDSQLQSLEFMKQSLESLAAVRNSLGPVKDVLDKMKSDLKGESLSLKDLIRLDFDESGNPTVSLKTDRIDPSKIDLTEFPADLVSQAIDTQKALEEIVSPLAESQSTLLRSLEKIQSGLKEGSEKFEKVAKAVKRIQQAWDLFDTAMEGEVSSDQLIEAFDTYFSGMLDVFAETIGKVPGLGAFLNAYATAIHNIVPTLKKIDAATVAKNEAIASVFGQTTEGVATTAPSGDLVSQQVESLDEQIQALQQERWELLDAAQREAARLAKIEIDQFWAEAGRRVDASGRFDWSYDGISEVVFEQMNALWIAWPQQLERLRAVDPNDPQIEVIEAKMAETSAKLRENWRIQIEMRKQRVDELEKLVRQHHTNLQEADLQELLNRFPQLEDAVNDIRAGNPQGTAVTAPAPTPKTAVPAGGGISGRVKAAVGVGVVAVVVTVGTFLFGSGGSDCPDTGALMAAGAGVAGSENPCPDDESLISVGDEATTSDDQAAIGGDTTDDGDDTDVAIGDDAATTDEPDPGDTAGPTFVSLAGPLAEQMQAAGSVSFPSLIEAIDANAAAVDDASGPILIDPPGDQIYSDPNVEPFVRSAVADINTTNRFQIAVDWDDFPGATGPGGDFGCDRADALVVVVCPDGGPPLPDEPGAWVFVGINNTIPGVGGEGELIYSYVVETDGDPANDWQPQGPYAWDFYQGTDTWFELFGDLSTGQWRAAASRVTADQTIEEAELPFRVIIWDDTVWWWIPESSAPADAPFRVSAFSHDGTYDPSSANGDVPGADPTEGLLP